MKLSVSKLNRFLEEIDLAKEIEGIEKEETSFLIGRSSDCHVQLNDKTVSREHAVLTHVNGSWSIKNSASFGNLLVNGTPVEKSDLNSGDLIKVGDFNISTFIEQVFDEEPVVEEIVEEIEPQAEVEQLDQETEVVSSENTIESNTEDESDEPSESNEFLGEEEGSFESADDEISEFPEDNDGTETFGFEEEGEEYYEEEGEYPVEEYDEDVGEKTSVAISFAKVTLELMGEHAPYDQYNIKDNEILIGRDPEKCQIVLNDPEVSSLHAVIKRTNISCVLEDLQSSNGTLLNGVRINKNELQNGDEFIIGSTTFTVSIGSDFLANQADMLMPVEENQMIEVEEIVEVGEDDFSDDDIDFGDESSGSQSLFSKDALKNPEKRKKLLIGAVVLIGLWVVLDDSSTSEAPKKAKTKKEKVANQPKLKPKIVLTPEQTERAESLYQLAVQFYNTGDYREAIESLDQVFLITKEYKRAQEVYNLSKDGLAKIQEIAEAEAEAKRKAALKLKVKELLDKARVAVEERRVEFAESLFSQIKTLDPENYDVSELILELEAYKKEENRKAVEAEAKKAERDRMVQALKPGETFFLKKEWYKAILKLEDFMRVKDVDEDLVKKGANMLDEAKTNLNGIIQPLLGKARSLKEGQDLKGAYETYNDILKYDPSSKEALNEMDEIRSSLKSRSKKIYREALIAESLNKYDEAKQLFQEVQQVSPSDSDYYKKASLRLKEYLD